MDVFANTWCGDGRWLNVTTFALPTGDPDVGTAIAHLFRDATKQQSNQRLVDHILEVSRERRSKAERPARTWPAAAPAPDPRFEALTPREWEVLLPLTHGLGTEEIAGEFSISPTRRNHAPSVLGKLKVHSRPEVVAYAYRTGFIEVDD